MPTIKYNYDVDAPSNVSLPSLFNYTDDFGVKRLINAVFRYPSDFPIGLAVSIVDGVGGALRDGLNPCGSDGFSPRRLVFKRSNGNSFSIVARTSSPIVIRGVAQAVVDLVNAAGIPKIVCVELIGERHSDAYESLADSSAIVRPAFATIPYIEPAVADGKSAVFYVGTAVEYVSDSTTVITPVRIKSLSRTELAPLAELGLVFAGCVGQVEEINLACSGSRNISYRRAEVEFATDLGGNINTQTVTVPITDTVNVANACVGSIALIAGVTCIRYIGEDHSRYHIAASLTMD